MKRPTNSREMPKGHPGEVDEGDRLGHPAEEAAGGTEADFNPRDEVVRAGKGIGLPPNLRRHRKKRIST